MHDKPPGACCDDRCLLWVVVGVSMALAADAAAGNERPIISGTPPAEVTAGQPYSFTPVASDPDGDSLYFWTRHRPTWTTIDRATGRLYGTPSGADAGTYSDIVISATDGDRNAPLAPFSITVVPGSAGTDNQRPVISGTPPTEVVAGQLYSFTPVASDPDGDPLYFWTRHRPHWATIDRWTGRLYGTPGSADIGTYSDIVISATDGDRNAPLTPFSITVVPSSVGSATLTWIPPTQRTDGSPLDNLGGYRILWGTMPDSYTNSVDISNPGLTTYVVENLSPATYYFVIVAIDANGLVSEPSNMAQKTVQPAP